MMPQQPPPQAPQQMQRVGPYGRALPNVEGMLSMRIPGQFGTGYGLFGTPQMNPFATTLQALSGQQGQRFGSPSPVNQGLGQQRAQPLTPFEGQQAPTALARLRLMGRALP